MKKILFTICAFFLFIPLWAQNVTQQDLQGNWKLITYIVPGATLDIASGKVTMGEQKNPMDIAVAEKLRSEMESYAEGLSQATLEIKGNNFYRIFYDVVNNGPFTIVDKSDHQVISANFDDGSKVEIPFRIKDGKLYTTNTEKSKLYIYEKQ